MIGRSRNVLIENKSDFFLSYLNYNVLITREDILLDPKYALSRAQLKNTKTLSRGVLTNWALVVSQIHWSLTEANSASRTLACLASSYKTIANKQLLYSNRSDCVSLQYQTNWLLLSTFL